MIMATFAAWLKAQDGRKDGVGELSRWWNANTPGRISAVPGVRKVIEQHAGTDDARRAYLLDVMTLAVSEYNDGRQAVTAGDQPRTLTDAEQARWDAQMAADGARPPLAAVPDPVPPAEPAQDWARPAPPFTPDDNDAEQWGQHAADGRPQLPGEVADEAAEQRANQGWQAVPGADGNQDEADFVNEVVHEPGAPDLSGVFEGSASDRLDRLYEQVTGQKAPEHGYGDAGMILMQTAEVITDVVVPAQQRIERKLAWIIGGLAFLLPDQALASLGMDILNDQDAPPDAAEDADLLAAAATADFRE